MSLPALHIVKPHIVAPLGSSADTPMKVQIQSSTLLELIETIYHSEDSPESQSRTIGTLLGTRSDDGSRIEVKECYIVPHKEEDEELTIEEANHIATYHLYKRSNPELQVIGWFSTSPELDNYTGLFHEFYAKGSCAPYQPILLTLKHKEDETEGAEGAESAKIVSPTVQTYISSPVGLPTNSPLARRIGVDKVGSYAFVPVPNEVTFSKNELTALKFLSESSKKEKSELELSGLDELKQVQNTVSQISDLIKILSDYSKRAASGEIEGNDKIGKQLLSNISYKPSSIDVSSLKSEFEKHLDDTLLVQYLASCIKQQLDISAKLTNFEAPEEAVN